MWENTDQKNSKYGTFHVVHIAVLGMKPIKMSVRESKFFVLDITEQF